MNPRSSSSADKHGIDPANRSVSAAIGAVNAQMPVDPGAFPSASPGNPVGHFLAEMASHDLDAALQLLAERAQYITGASGAAIALRRGQHPDMLCRASAGSNAPELGALLSMEYGLSGESLRTRQILRCDDIEGDVRVNHDACRRLGIASVVIMPVVCSDQAVGVFEIFSGLPHAFAERDLSALRRLSGMVETAVAHASAMQYAPAGETAEPPAEETIAVVAAPIVEGVPVEPVPVPVTSSITEPTNAKASEAKTEVISDAEGVKSPPANTQQPASAATESPTLKTPVAEPKRPLYWSAGSQTQDSENKATEKAPVPVPLGLRNLQKCEACGFPVSSGRKFCVECEEKQWRGQRAGKSKDAAARPGEVAPTAPESVGASSIKSEVAATEKSADVLPRETQAGTDGDAQSKPALDTTTTAGEIDPSFPALNSDSQSSAPRADETTLFLSATQSESWLAANKYLLGMLLLVAIIIAAVMWLR